MLPSGFIDEMAVACEFIRKLIIVLEDSYILYLATTQTKFISTTRKSAIANGYLVAVWKRAMEKRSWIDTYLSVVSGIMRCSQDSISPPGRGCWLDLACGIVYLLGFKCLMNCPCVVVCLFIMFRMGIVYYVRGL